MIYFYNILLNVLIILSLPLMVPYLLIVKKRRKTALYRLRLVIPKGAKQVDRLKSSTSKHLWVHAMSVGEVYSARPMIRRIKETMPDAVVFLTVSTLTGYQTALQTLVDDADDISFYPYDFYSFVKSAMDRIRPDMFMLIESDCWPNILNEMKKQNIPTIFVNARLSERSFSSFEKIKRFARLIFCPFTHICVQSDEDARRFHALGIDKNAITVTGNIKFDQNIEPATENEIDTMRKMVGAGDFQKIWVAGSTHTGEEEIIAESLGKIKKTVDNLMLVIAPRDPNRSKEVKKVFTESGFQACSLSDIESGNNGGVPEVVVIDRIGLLQRLYAIGDIALVGGSLAKIKGTRGHNPLEPAGLSKPIIFGKYMNNFSDIAHRFLSAKGAAEVVDAHGLSDTLLSLFSNPEKASGMGRRAYHVFADSKGALKSTMDIITAYLEKKPGREPSVVKIPTHPLQKPASFRAAHHER